MIDCTPVGREVTVRYGRLRVTTPDGQVHEHGLDVPVVTIGRSSENTIVIDDVSVSRRHARVTIDSGTPLIEDLGSENGIYLGNQRLAPNQRQMFSQASVRIGAVEVAYLPPDTAGRPSGYVGPAAAAPAGAPGSAPNPSPTAQSLAVTLRGPAAPITAGGVGTATVQIHNRGTTVDEVAIAVVDLPAGWAEVTRTGIPLLPGAREEVTVMLRPPRAATAVAGEHPFAVAVTSRANGAEIRAVGSLTLEPFAGMNVGMQPVRSDRNFTISVENTGNTPLALALSAQDDEGTLQFEFSSLNVDLPPGQRTTVRLRAKMSGAPKFGREIVKPFAVEARQQGASDRTKVAGQLRVKPPLQAWKMPVMALLVLAGLTGGGVTYARQCETWSLPGCRDSNGVTPAGGDGSPVASGGSPTVPGGGPTQQGGGGGQTPMSSVVVPSETMPGGGAETPTTPTGGSATATVSTTSETSTSPTATQTPPTAIRFDKAEKVLEPNLDYVAIVTTTVGEFTLDLDITDAYETSNSFAFLATKGFYDGLPFKPTSGTIEHGDGDGEGTAGYTQPVDLTDVSNKRGTVGMVPIEDDSGEVGSVWYINTKDNVLFDTGGFTGADVRQVFATITAGMDVVDSLTDEDTVKSIEIRAKTVRPFPFPSLVIPSIVAPFKTQPPILLP